MPRALGGLPAGLQQPAHEPQDAGAGVALRRASGIGALLAVCRPAPARRMAERRPAAARPSPPASAAGLRLGAARPRARAAPGARSRASWAVWAALPAAPPQPAAASRHALCPRPFALGAAARASPARTDPVALAALLAGAELLRPASDGRRGIGRPGEVGRPRPFAVVPPLAALARRLVAVGAFKREPLLLAIAGLKDGPFMLLCRCESVLVNPHRRQPPLARAFCACHTPPAPRRSTVGRRRALGERADSRLNWAEG